MLKPTKTLNPQVMDVRCEKCKTEYELDESKLKPGGVTVKCTSCGHMFKIRKRSPTNVGIPTGSIPTQRSGRAPSSGPPPVMQASAVDSGPMDAQSKRTWLIKLENGETKTCRELATLQQWIVAGLVTRRCQISRSGNKWKQLGEIAELSKFFTVADEARHARAQRSPSSSGPVAAPRAPTPQPVPAAQPQAPTMLSGPPAGASKSPLPLQPPRISAEAPAAAAPRVAQPVKVSDAAESRSTGNWAVDAKLTSDLEGAGPSGPVGGLAKGIPTDDVAFAGGKIAPLRTGFADSLEPTYDHEDDDYFPHRRGGAGKWIVIGSLVVIAAAVALVYLFVFRDSDETQAATDDSVTPDTEVVDAGVVAEAPPPDAAVDMSTDDGVLEALPATIYGDVAADLTEMSVKLADIKDGNKQLPVLVARARVHGALAQHLTDEAGAASKKAARKIKKKVTAEVNKGMAAVKKALKLDKTDVGANVAMADLMRLQGKRARQIDRYLKKHLKGGEYEARYVNAMILLRDKRRKKAIEALGTVKAQGEADVRPSYRLARIAFGDKDYDTARADVNRVVEAQPEHPGALALIERINAATEVVTSDPMPPEDRGSGGGGDSYDRLVGKADKAAEAGRCGSAIKLYKKAINKNPSGVAALTGLGYCYIETKQFASAHRQFQIALGLSPRYVPALWGVAEAYQQQGRNDLAIKAYKKYLDMHPTGGRAAAAKRQIEKLGGSTDAPPDDPPPDDPPPDDPPPDDPPPDDPPPDDPPPDDPPPDDPPPDDPPDDPTPDPVPETPPPDPDPDPGPD